jgi:hypothetical protein
MSTNLADPGPAEEGTPYIDPKVQAGAAAGAASVVLVWVLGLLGVDTPPEVASAITVLLSVAAGYLK